VSPSPFRRIPPVHALLEAPELTRAIAERGREPVLNALRELLADVRRALAEGREIPLDSASLIHRALERLQAEGPTLRPVINATGVLIHTGLGRAPLASEAVEAVAEVARGYSNLEFDLETGGRGRRTAIIADRLKRLVGSEAATVVNNNAGATLLTLRAIAAGREVIVSRGQLVEIGGSFRLPEVFEASGARLREVGTTNKTRLRDYEAAIGPETAAILRVHSSNYRIVGFTESAPIAELARLAHERGLIAIDDIGSGALDRERPGGLSPDEPTVADSLEAGADLVLFSGDKLLGGPQCGLIAGRSGPVRTIEADPMMRALRVDKMTLAALEATLACVSDAERGRRTIPLWRLLAEPVDRLRARAGRLAERLRRSTGVAATAEQTTAFLGGGSAPGDEIASAALRLEPPLPGEHPKPEEAARTLRLGDPPVVGRVRHDALWLDLRTVLADQDETLAAALEAVLNPSQDSAEPRTAG